MTIEEQLRQLDAQREALLAKCNRIVYAKEGCHNAPETLGYIIDIDHEIAEYDDDYRELSPSATYMLVAYGSESVAQLDINNLEEKGWVFVPDPE